MIGMPSPHRMQTLVLLPGMDGSGALFTPLLAAATCKCQVVSYPPTEMLGYGELESLVRAALPQDEPYFLLGESFSGPIAIAIAASPPPQLRGVILSCTFARNPRPGLGILKGLIPYLPPHPPLALLEYLLCGRHANPELRAMLEEALAQVTPDVLRHRLAAAAGANVLKQLREVRIPTLYLKGAEDRVIPAAASEEVLENAVGIKLVQLDAPHFLLQTMPGEAVRAIDDFMTTD